MNKTNGSVVETSVFPLPGVQEAIDRIPNKTERDLLRVYLFGGLSLTEISEKGKVPLSAVKAVFHRAEMKFFRHFADTARPIPRLW